MQFVKNGPDIPERFLQAHEEGKVVFFCGAGISRAAGLPLFYELYDQLRLLFNGDDPLEELARKKEQFDHVIHLLEKRLVDGRFVVRKELAKILTPGLSAPEAKVNHQTLLTLAQHDDSLRLVTTNFDRLFEETIKSESLKVKTYQAPLLPIPKKRWNGLVYLHGLLSEKPVRNELDELVFSSGDFGLAYLNDGWATRFVRELFRNYIVCFVGYSAEDVVLRYMLDALAADSLRGESSLEVFAFAGYQKEKEEKVALNWQAKGITPILFDNENNYSYLYSTLKLWSEQYRDGILGKESIIMQYAGSRPKESTSEDNFVGRVLWALSDESGIPASCFANYSPTPSLDWLDYLIQPCFENYNFVGLSSNFDHSQDKRLFSFIKRPVNRVPTTLVSDDSTNQPWDLRMEHISNWMCKYLNNPKLLLWVAKEGRHLHPRFADKIEQKLLDGSINLTPKMLMLWNIMLAGKIKNSSSRFDPSIKLNLWEWHRKLKTSGLNFRLRLELKKLFTPYVLLKEPFQIPVDEIDKIDYEFVLNANNQHLTLKAFLDDDSWKEALPHLLTDATQLLNETLDLMCALGYATKLKDNSYSCQPSIEAHEQNRGYYEWTALIELTREAWLAAAKKFPERARLETQRWRLIPYPIFRRLTFFAATRLDIIPASEGVELLLANNNWWLWSYETKRETLRLIVILGPKLDSINLRKLENAILQGPPDKMFAGVEVMQRQNVLDKEIWLRLSKFKAAGATLSSGAISTLKMLAQHYPSWKLASDQSDEFPSWLGGDEWGTNIITPKRRRELVTWILENPEPNHRQKDDWAQRCKNDFPITACALIELSLKDKWPILRWREALESYSAEPSLLKRSWRYLGGILILAPDEILKELSFWISCWLEAISRTLKEAELTFLSLIERPFFTLTERLLAQEYENNLKVDEDYVSRAINHPVGQITEAVLRWHYRQGWGEKEGLPEKIKSLLTRLCNTQKSIFRHARVILSGHVINLFYVDPDWTQQQLLPLFDWQKSLEEAKAAWQGLFYYCSYLERSLFEALKTQFLQTAEHYAHLGPCQEKYIKMLTLAALDIGELLSEIEVKTAMKSLPLSRLLYSAETLLQVLHASGKKREECWVHRIQPYWEKFWPKSHKDITPEVGALLSRVCVAAGNEFPNAMDLVGSWLRPLNDVSILRLICEKKLAKSFPRETLKLLSIIINTPPQLFKHDLKTCLASILNADPSLQLDHHYKKLAKYSL